MIKAVIFDMDGVLIDSEPIWLKKLDHFLKYKGIYLTENELNKIVGASSKLTWSLLRDRFESPMTLEVFQEELKDYQHQTQIEFKTLLNEGVNELLSWLKNKGFSIALASSSSMEAINKVIGQCDLSSFFEVVLSGDMFNESKPNPEIYLTTAKQLKVEPKECIVVEDSVYGIAAAKAAGMYTIAKEELRFNFEQTAADKIVVSLLEIRGIVKEIASV